MMVFYVIDRYHGQRLGFKSYEEAAVYCYAAEIEQVATAMVYLSETDPTLEQSIQILEDRGFMLEEINSKRLASAHLRKELLNSIKLVVGDSLSD